MTQASPTHSAASSTASVVGLKVVLFGPPHAGKSSLLGALAQVAHSQAELLGGTLQDVSHGLTELQLRLYENRPRETDGEVVPYLARFERRATPDAPSSPLDLVLIDCDGRVANELISQPRSLERDAAEGTLASAILDAAALLLVLDSSANARELEPEFEEFHRFLRLFRFARGKRGDVGGLPVFLVLSKCDLLAQPKDSAAAWVERIEERKRHAHELFRTILESSCQEGVFPFGALSLGMYATAVKLPELVDSPEQPHTPHGVGELFRDVFERAERFDGRRRSSSRRLSWIVGLSLMFVTLFLAFAISLGTRPTTNEPGELLAKVDLFRSREGQTPSARLREPLQPKISELTDLQTDPQFSSLDPERKEYVQSRLKELREYQQYKEKLQQVRTPAAALDDRDLQQIEANLRDLPLPKDRQAEWSQTEAAVARSRQLEDIRSLRAAVLELDEWYRRLAKRGEELWSFADPKSVGGPSLAWPAWDALVSALLEQADAPARRPVDRLATSTSVTYAAAYRQDRVREARGQWLAVKQRLLRIRDIGSALGLLGRIPSRPAVFADLAGVVSKEQLQARAQELQKAYPRYIEEFHAGELPDAVSVEIRRTAKADYEQLLPVGREIVSRHLQEASSDGRESLESWRRLRSWLSAPEDLQAWRTLALPLARLGNIVPPDPIQALSQFVRQDQFELEFRQLELRLPESAGLRPTGEFVVHLRRGDSTRADTRLQADGEAKRDARSGSSIHFFRPVVPAALVYRPGDELWAELPVRDAGGREGSLIWDKGRSQVYQFERLTRPPRLVRKEQPAAEGKPLEDASVAIVPDRAIPTLPDLLPNTRQDER